MAFKDSPIKRKIMMVITLTSSTALLLTSTAFTAYEMWSFRQAMVRNLSTLAGIIANNSTASLAFGNESDARNILSALKAERPIVAAGLYDKDGKLFATYPESEPPAAFPTAPESDGHRFEKTHLTVFQPVVEAGKRQGTLYLKSDLREMNERFRLYSMIVILLAAGSLFVALALSTIWQKRIFHPILALTETAKVISERKDYAVRAMKFSHDEIGLLTDAFNDMLIQIQERDAHFRQLNEELEQRVIERTAQFATVNAELQSGIAERERAEKEIRQLNESLQRYNTQLKASNKELEAFSYTISHDLRAPLRAIHGFSRILLEEFASQLPDEAPEYLRLVSNNAEHMGHLIDGLLNFSRLSRQSLNKQPVAPAELVRQVLEELQSGEQSSHATISIGDLPVCQADPVLLKQVFVNLLGNALKYTSHKEQAMIEVGSNNGDSSSGKTIYYVKDNGAGFDMQYANKLFGVFQRLHTADEYEGTGVGLAIVQRIILRHGGSVWAEAKINHGATFFFTLVGGSHE